MRATFELREAAWSPQAAKTLTELPEPAREKVRDILDIAVRSPRG
ncbi:hypothetical protein ACFWA6_05405 [Streptomyces sp. NPDC060020]